MKSLYFHLSILLLGSASLSAQEKHPHSHSDKTKESHAHEETLQDQENEAKDEHGHSHGKEKKEEGGDAHEDHGHGQEAEHEEHKDHGDEKESHEGAEGEHHEEDHEEEEFSSSVGPGNAVTAADESQGIQLSDNAQRTLDIRLEPVAVSLPKSAVVTSKEETSVYRFRDGWFKLIEGQITDVGTQRVTFRPRSASDFKKGDQVVVNGAPLLRVAELDAFAGEAAGHGH